MKSNKSKTMSTRRNEKGKNKMEEKNDDKQEYEDEGIDDMKDLGEHEEENNNDNDLVDDISKSKSSEINSKNPTKKVVLTKKKLQTFQKDMDRRGVIYFSRVPPLMTPTRLRSIMSDFGAIGRVFIKPEKKTETQIRRSHGGSKKVRYTEGWIEFMDKKLAYRVAISLNNTPVGGSRRSIHHSDIWNIKYLPKFKWHHLTEKIAYEKNVQEHRQRTAISQSNRTNEFYLSQVEKAKIQDIMRKRKSKSDPDNFEHGNSSSTKKIKKDDNASSFSRKERFRQFTPIDSSN